MITTVVSDIALLTLQKSVLLVLSQSLEKKNGSVWKISNSYELSITNSDNESFCNCFCCKGISCLPRYLSSKNWWNIANRKNSVILKTKYTVCVKKWMHSRTFASWQNWYFCRNYLLLFKSRQLQHMWSWNSRQPVNLGDGEGIQVPYKLKLTGRSKFVNILTKFLSNEKINCILYTSFFYLRFFKFKFTVLENCFVNYLNFNILNF